MDNKRIDQAEHHFQNEPNCCQAILLTYGPNVDLSEETAFRLGTGFGGGIAGHGDLCGAVSGALMIISLKYGMKNKKDKKAKEKTVTLVSEFINKFQHRNGSLKCNDLLGCDIRTEEGFRFIKKNKLFKTRCPELVRNSAEILEEILSTE